MKNIMDSIRRWLSCETNVNGTNVDERTSWTSLGFDAMDKTLLEIALEDEWDVVMPRASELAWDTLGDLKNIVENLLWNRTADANQDGAVTS